MRLAKPKWDSIDPYAPDHSVIQAAWIRLAVMPP